MLAGLYLYGEKMKKTIILDTNVYLTEAGSILAFGKNNIAIPTIVLDEIANYLFFVNRKDEDIVLTIKTKRARENINRKAAFDRMSSDMQNTQKLFRRFNIGTIFEGYADEDVEINELVMQGNDMAEDSRLNLGITDEEAEQQMMLDLAMGDQYDDTQLGIGIHGNDEMVNLYGGDDE